MVCGDGEITVGQARQDGLGRCRLFGICLDARADGIRGGIRGERLVDGDKLLKTIHLNQLIDVFVWIGIRQ